MDNASCAHMVRLLIRPVAEAHEAVRELARRPEVNVELYSEGRYLIVVTVDAADALDACVEAARILTEHTPEITVLRLVSCTEE